MKYKSPRVSSLLRLHTRNGNNGNFTPLNARAKLVKTYRKSALPCCIHILAFVRLQQPTRAAPRTGCVLASPLKRANIHRREKAVAVNGSSLI